MRQRIAAASAVLEKYARVQLKVVAVDTWQSDNATTDFFDSLNEFERKVKPFPAQLAIGFTSQYQMVTGRVHLAGTHGPLSTHILVREWSQHISEPERLELLVHELGHFLGASHSPEQTSVMRPVMGNRQAVRVDFQVRFDPVNALIIGMVGEEMGRRSVHRWSDLTQGTRDRLKQIYGALSQTLPTDSAAGQFIQSVNPATLTSLQLDTKAVLGANYRGGGEECGAAARGRCGRRRDSAARGCADGLSCAAGGGCGEVAPRRHRANGVCVCAGDRARYVGRVTRASEDGAVCRSRRADERPVASAVGYRAADIARAARSVSALGGIWLSDRARWEPRRRRRRASRRS